MGGFRLGKDSLNSITTDAQLVAAFLYGLLFRIVFTIRTDRLVIHWIVRIALGWESSGPKSSLIYVWTADKCSSTMESPFTTQTVYAGSRNPRSLIMRLH